MPSLATLKLILAGAAALALVAGGFYSGYRWELGAYETRVAQDAQAQAEAVQKVATVAAKQSAVKVAAAEAEGQAQAKIEVQTVTVTKEIPVYVTKLQDDRGCVTVGFLRVLRGAATQADPDTLGLATGQSDDDCSTVTASALASNLASLYGTALANNEQLAALQAWIVANQKAQAQ